jgi:vancomycin permeability regulator SanA
MRQYLLQAGVPAEEIASDGEGFDTYSSVYRAKNVFLADSLIIVSQDFHLPRAIFIARMMHIKAYGIVAPRGARLYDYLREIPASWKAVWDLVSGRVPVQSAILAPLVVAGAHA